MCNIQIQVIITATATICAFAIKCMQTHACKLPHTYTGVRWATHTNRSNPLERFVTVIFLWQPSHDRWFKSQKHRWATYDNGTICVNGTEREGGQEFEWATKRREVVKVGERQEKVQHVICTCLPANCLQWAAFVQWPMQLEWRLLSKSSCRAPDKRIKNYDIF